jgi:hypothetical protein
MKTTDYIQGQRKGKDAHRIEKEAMRDPFLSDALDGFDAITDSHISRIEDMRKQVSASTRKKINHWKYWSIAASILVIFSLGGYWLIREISPGEEFYAYEMVHAEEAEENKEKNAVRNDENAIRRQEDGVRGQEDAIRGQEDDIRGQEDAVRGQEDDIRGQEDDIRGQEDDVRGQESIVPLKEERIIHKKEPDTLAPPNIKGLITDSHGEPLTGASITQQGTHYGAISDIDGRFSFNAADTGSLKISYLGYEDRTVSLDSAGQELLIAMHENAQALDEVIVIGYATQKRRSVTGAVRRIEAGNKAPEPVSGEKAYRKYLKDNRIRPVDEACKDVRGDVKLRLSVDTNGRPMGITIIKSLCPSADREAIRLIEEGPDWTPGNKTAEITVKF